MKTPYDDIIHLPHHVSSTRPQMPIADRAAQFSPFAALTGHGAAIQETARLTSERIELGEDARAALDRKINLLADMAAEHPEAVVLYFRPDERKEGGSYVATTGAVKKIDAYTHILVMMDGTKIPVAEILEIESELFRAML